MVKYSYCYRFEDHLFLRPAPIKLGLIIISYFTF